MQIQYILSSGIAKNETLVCICIAKKCCALGIRVGAKIMEEIKALLPEYSCVYE